MPAKIYPRPPPITFADAADTVRWYENGLQEPSAPEIQSPPIVDVSQDVAAREELREPSPRAAHTRETRRKLSELGVKRFAEPEVRRAHGEKIAAALARPEVQRRCAENWRDAGIRARRLKGLRAYWKDPARLRDRDVLLARQSETCRRKRWARFRGDFAAARLTGDLDEVLCVAKRHRYNAKCRLRARRLAAEA